MSKETRVEKYDGNWIKWLEDSRVGFTRQMANKYMRIARELGTTVIISNGWSLNDIAINTLYKLVSAPEEVKEEY